MLVLYTVLLLLLIFLIVDLTQGFRVWLTANIEDDKTNIRIRYLYPLFAAQITVVQGQPILEVRLFHLQVYRGILAKKKKPNKRTNTFALLKSATYRELSIFSKYGFQDPFYTGICYGSLGSLTNLLNVQTLTVVPDFFATNNYVSLSADADFSLGQTIIKYFKNK